MADSTSAVIPRWEWRTFAESLDKLESLAPVARAAKARQSSEIYILILGGPQNVKVRDGKIDIKRLKDVDASGFELWEPVFKADFPLSPQDVERVFAEWGVAPPASARESWPLDRFLAELVAPVSKLKAVSVEKLRRGFDLGGCAAEVATISFNGGALQSFSIESEDRAKMTAALRSLGMNKIENVNYPKGLKRALGLADL